MVYHNIMDSDISVTTHGYTFYFSSEWYKERFERQKDDYAEQRNIRFNSRKRVKISLEDYFILLLYCNIETRGFKVEVDGMQWLEPAEVQLKLIKSTKNG